MTPDVVAVQTLENYELQVTFSDGECRRFSMISYLGYPAYKSLREPGRFMTAHIENGTVVWNDEMDISPDTLYLAGQKIEAATA